MPKVYIIVVNWNGWEDTIECLESVYRLKYDDFSVILCDNGSINDSLERIAEWAEGKILASSANPQLKHLSHPPYPKPIPFSRIDAHSCQNLIGRKERLFLIQIGRNLGFAAGNNVGLRLALNTGDMKYAWLLNNDTVVAPDALIRLVERMEESAESGLCGSTLLYYDDGKTVQALGGAHYNRWTARVGHIGCGLTLELAPSRDYVEEQMDYVVGASMLVRLSFLENVGLMNDRYFLFFEEIDWITRARGKFHLAYCPESIVYHKQGRSTGEGPTKNRALDNVGGRYGPRSRILFTRIHHPIALVSVVVALLASAAFRLATGRFASFKTLMHGVLSGTTMSLNDPSDDFSSPHTNEYESTLN